MSYAWSYGEILAAVEKVTPSEQPALVHGDRTINWGDFTRRTSNLARKLIESGVKPGEKIAFYMRNCPEYSEGIAAAFKASLVHVNVNYRYIDHEVIYLLDNADATVVVHGAEFQHLVDQIRGELPDVKHWLAVDSGNPSPFEDMANQGNGSAPDIKHSPDDLLLLYTGGTTGMPKGVMWRHDDLFQVQGAGGNPRLGIPPCPDLDAFIAKVSASSRPVNMPLPPMMHGTGLLSAISAIVNGGTCVTLPCRSFEPELALENIERHRVTTTNIVGDAFARPLLEALDSNPDRWDISSLAVLSSSGVMWTRELKAGLLRHHENVLLVDGFSSSEAFGLGFSIMTKDQEIEVASFKIGPNCRVLTEDFKEVQPGSGETGMVADRGFLPVGYYKDQKKTDETFKVIGGVRYSIPGDWVRVEDNGSLTLLGRGSNCINTAGEKVYPEEVEEVLKYHDSVNDALVLGVKNEKWGQSITAVVQLAPGSHLDELELREFSRQHLAAYKIPKRILQKENLERAPNGKADYKSIRSFAESALGIS